MREIFRQLTDTGNANDYKTAKDKLREYFEPQKNRRYEVFKFRQAKQESNETLDQFHTRLRVLAQTCSFNDADFEIEQQIIINGISSRIRKKALREPDYDWKQILLDSRRAEQSEFQARLFLCYTWYRRIINLNVIDRAMCEKMDGVNWT